MTVRIERDFVMNEIIIICDGLIESGNRVDIDIWGLRTAGQLLSAFAEAIANEGNAENFDQVRRCFAHSERLLAKAANLQGRAEQYALRRKLHPQGDE